MPQLKAPDGSIIFAPDNQATHLLAQGYTPVGAEEAGAALTKPEDTQGGLGGAVSAGLTSAASGATLGLSDVALAGILNHGDLDAVRQAREDHPIVTAAGQLTGALAPALVAPESLLGRTPAGYLSRIAGEATEGAKAIGGLKGIANVAAIGGAEGALQSTGMYISDVALGDRDLSAEGLSGAVGRGFLFGGVASGGMLGIEKGTMAARRLFARVAEGGAEAAGDAATTFDRKLDDTLTAHEDTADIARKRLDEIRQMKSEASAQKMRAEAELAQAKLEAFRGKGRVPEEVPAGAPATPTESPAGPPAMPETAGPAGETQVSQTNSATPGPTPTGSLEDQLAATKAGLDQGATIQDLNAARASRGTTVTNAGDLGPDVAAEEQKLSDALGTYEQRRAKVDEWVARIKNPRTKYTAEGTAESIGAGIKPAVRGKLTKALDEDVFVEQSGGNIRTIGKGEHSLEDITPNSRILARSNGENFSQGAHLDEIYQDAIERAGLAENAAEREAALNEAADIEQQIHKYVRDTKPENAAVIDKINEVRSAAGRTGYHAAFARAERKAMDAANEVEGKLAGVNPEQEAAYQEALAGKIPRQPVNAGFLKDAEEQGYTMRAARIAEERLKKGMPALADEQLARVVRPTVEPIHEAAQVLGDYEKAAADLVEAVGPAAPPAAQQAAAAYRAAEDAADRKLIDRTTRAVDDHVASGAETPMPEQPGEQFGPFEEVKPTGPNPKERAASAREVKLEADAKLSKLKIEEGKLKEQLPAKKVTPAKAKLAPEVVTPPPPAAPMSRMQRALHIADKVGQGLEVANMAGIPGLPKPSDLPVVGPILGAFLKFRALTGKLSGRIAATGDAKAAALAARTRDRAAHAIDRMLGLAEKAAPTARTVAVTTATRTGELLVKRYFDDGHPDAPEGASPRELATVRAREIAAAAANPQAVIAHVRQQMKGVSDPDLIAAMEQQKLREVQYLAANIPKAPPENPLVKRPWVASGPDAQSLARRLEVVDDPVAALEQVDRKCLTPEAAEAMRVCAPKLFAEAQQRMMQRSTQIQDTVPHGQRMRMSLLFDVPLDPTLDPETITTLQTSGLPTNRPADPTQPSPPVPSTAGPVNLASLYETASDRRAARR